MLDIMQLRSYARAKALVEAPDSDKVSLAKAGVPESAVSLVMANVLRAKRPDG